MKKAVGFLKDIGKKDDAIIVFNNDADGICSCVLLEKVLHMRSGKRSYSIAQPMPPDKNLIRKVQTSLPSKIIFADMAIDQQPQLVKKLAGICDVLIIDHHQINQNLNSKKIVHFNPRIDDPRVYQSTSYLAYRICGEILDMRESLWVAAVGMVADYNLDFSQDVVEEIRKRFGIKGKLYDSWIGRIADMIEAARATKTYTCEQMMEIILSAKSQEDVLNDSKFMEAYREMQHEIMTIMDDVKKSGEFTGNIIFYNIKSRYGLSSYISTRMSEVYKNRLIIVYQKAGSRIKVSARNQAGMNVGRILGKAVESFGSGGGHEAAAGATMPENEWEQFKENVIRLAKLNEK